MHESAAPMEMLTLYARRDAADQLRKINNISLEITDRSIKDGLVIVHVRAKDGKGRIDEDVGVVSTLNLTGDAAANAIMKAITKAKRRVTLSLSGLGFLDETEIEDIPEKAAFPPSVLQPANPEPAPINPETGTVSPHHLPVALNGNDKSDWIRWGSTMLAAVKTAKTIPEVEAWLTANRAPIRTINQDMPKVADRLTAAINHVKATLA